MKGLKNNKNGQSSLMVNVENKLHLYCSDWHIRDIDLSDLSLVCLVRLVRLVTCHIGHIKDILGKY